MKSASASKKPVVPEEVPDLETEVAGAKAVFHAFLRFRDPEDLADWVERVGILSRRGAESDPSAFRSWLRGEILAVDVLLAWLFRNDPAMKETASKLMDGFHAAVHPLLHKQALAVAPDVREQVTARLLVQWHRSGPDGSPPEDSSRP